MRVFGEQRRSLAVPSGHCSVRSRQQTQPNDPVAVPSTSQAVVAPSPTNAIISRCQPPDPVRHVQTAAAQETTARLSREEQGLAEAAATASILDAKMRHSALSLSMLDACMFAEAGPIVCRLSMMAIQPLLSFHNVRPPPRPTRNSPCPSTSSGAQPRAVLRRLRA